MNTLEYFFLKEVVHLNMKIWLLFALPTSFQTCMLIFFPWNPEGGFLKDIHTALLQQLELIHTL